LNDTDLRIEMAKIHHRIGSGGQDAKDAQKAEAMGAH
jgi:hypothetical protein